MQQFLEFVDRKQREAIKHLEIIKEIFKSKGIKVASHLNNDDPYIFVVAPKDLSFEGVRIYQIGNMMAYRVQREEKTEPYGKAYLLDLDEMFSDFMSENMKEEEAGHKVIENVIREFKLFFEKSHQAEDDIRSQDSEDLDIQTKTGGSDYSGMVFTKS